MENLRHQGLKTALALIAVVVTVFSLVPHFEASASDYDVPGTFTVSNSQTFFLNCIGIDDSNTSSVNYRVDYLLPVFFRFSSNLYYSTANPTSSVGNAVMIQPDIISGHGTAENFSQLVMNNYSTNWTTVQKKFSMSTYNPDNVDLFERTKNIRLNIAYRYTDTFISDVYETNSDVDWDYYTFGMTRYDSDTSNGEFYLYSNGVQYINYNSSYLFSFYSTKLGLLCQVVIASFTGNTAYSIAFPRFANQTFYFDGKIADSSYSNGYNQGKAAGLSEAKSKVDKSSQSYITGKKVGYAEGIKDGGDYSFFGLISAVVDVPISAFKGLLNFNLFGIDMSGLYLSLFTLCIIIMVVKLLL